MLSFHVYLADPAIERIWYVLGQGLRGFWNDYEGQDVLSEVSSELRAEGSLKLNWAEWEDFPGEGEGVCKSLLPEGYSEW